MVVPEIVVAVPPGTTIVTSGAALRNEVDGAVRLIVVAGDRAGPSVTANGRFSRSPAPAPRPAPAAAPPPRAGRRPGRRKRTLPRPPRPPPSFERTGRRRRRGPERPAGPGLPPAASGSRAFMPELLRPGTCGGGGGGGGIRPRSVLPAIFGTSSRNPPDSKRSRRRAAGTVPDYRIHPDSCSRPAAAPPAIPADRKFPGKSGG